MKRLILKLLGFDAVSIKALKTEIEHLQTTISSLKEEVTTVYNKTEDAFNLIHLLGIDKKDELWWENFSPNTKNFEVYLMAERIKTNAQREWVKKNPSLKVKKIFHGSCLSCEIPVKNGIGKCLGCCHANGSKFPDLSNSL